MRTHAVRLLVPLFLSLLAFGNGSQPVHAQSFYTATVLETLGGASATAEGIDDAGHIVGASNTADGKSQAFLWMGTGAPVAIPTLGGTTNTARAVNNAGHVVGDSATATGQTHAFVYRDNAVADLGALSGGNGSSTANDISDGGIVVGSSGNSLGQNRAVLWENGQIRELGTLGRDSVATGVNERGQVVGYSRLNNGLTHAFLWEDGIMRDLGSYNTNGTSQAQAINEAGMVVGSAGTSSGERPVLWEPSGAMRDIGLLTGDTYGSATGINDHGQVTGTSSASLYSPSPRVFLYSAGANVLELLDGLLGEDTTRLPRAAASINNSGQIASSSLAAYLNRRALRLDPSSTPRLVFAPAPGASVAGLPLEPQPVVQAWNAIGRVDTGFAGAVTLALKPGTGTAGAVLGGTVTVQAVNGVASFGDATIDRPGVGYVLLVSGPPAFSAQCPAFTVGLARLHVRTTGVDVSSGESWVLAKRTISSAVSSPLRVPQTEVWVAAGSYTESVAVKPGARLFGGFAGTETRLDERDAGRHVTAVIAPQGADVVTVASGATPATVVDGFTIRGGSNGIVCSNASPTIRNNVIDNNGRGIDCVGISSPVIESNTVSRSINGGISLNSGTPIVRGNLIRDNRFSYGKGGGIICAGGTPVVTGNTIVGNIGKGGGGIAVTVGAARIVNNVFVENVALNEDGDFMGLSGGGIYCQNSSPLIANNTFLANGAHNGGQIYVYQGTPVIANNLFAHGSSGLHNEGKTVVLRHNAFWSNGLYEIKGIAEGIGVNGNIEADPAPANLYARNVHLQPTSPLVDAGDGAYVIAGDLDMDGQPRVQGAAVDIGADESDGTAWALPRGILRVRADGNDANDGRTWADAKRTISAALSAASASGDEIWIARGVYPGGLVLESFTSLYGGFAGTEGALDQRDPARHQTILEGNGIGTDLLAVKNGGQVVVIDGLTVQNGRNGINVRHGASARVTNNTVHHNTASGIIAGGVSLIFGNRCVFNGHQDGGGTGIVASDAATVTGNVVERNAYRGNAAGAAGGIVISGQVEVGGNIVRDNIGAGIGTYGYGTTAGIRNNVVTGNTGDGISCYFGAGPIINNVVAHNGQVGLMLYETGTLLVANNTVVGNRKHYLQNAAGGVFCTSNSQATLVSNIIAFNNGGIEGTLFATVPLALRNNCVFGNEGKDFSGIPDPTGTDGNISADPLLAAVADGNFHIQPGSPCVDAGDAAGLPDGFPDMDGAERVRGARIDIGADESDGTVWAAVTRRVYVRPDGDDAADGQAWSKAMRTVQAGIDAVRNAGGGEVWVAGGTYPEAIHMGSHTRVYGGFRGDETDLSQRDAPASPSILDSGRRTSVAIPRGLGIGSVLDGFTIRNGAGGPVIFGTEDFACGGGVQLTDSYMTVSNNRITGNTARQGGGIWAQGGEPVIRGNSATDGAGLMLDGFTIQARSNLITGNTATGRGGGVFAQRNPHLVNNTFVGSTATNGGAVFVWFPGGNWNETHARLTNNILAFNSSGVFVETKAQAMLAYNDYFGNSAYDTAGSFTASGTTGNASYDPLFVDTAGGDYRLRAGSPARDSGQDSGVAVGETDFAGSPRLLGTHVDLGAYEMTPCPTIEDAIRALRIAGGLTAATESDRQRATEMTAESQETGITIVNALRMLQRSLGAE